MFCSIYDITIYPTSRTLGRFTHLYKGCFVLLPNQCGIPQSTPLRGRWEGFHTFIKGVLFSSPTNVGLFCSMWDITIYPTSRTLGRFPHPYKGCLVLLPNQCGTSQSTLFRDPPSSLALVPFSNQCGTATKSTPLWGAVSLLAHRLVSTTLRGTARRLTHRPISGSPPFGEQREG